MEFAGHKRIKSFGMEGTIRNDSDFARLRYQYQALVEEEMRYGGYIPHLDIDPVFTTSYNGVLFEFKITCYGIYVGKAKAKCYLGVTANRLIPIAMTQIKSEKLYNSVELP